MDSEPRKTNRRLGLVIHRVVHGCTFKVIQDVFDISKSIYVPTFNIAINIMVSQLFGESVNLPTSDEEWISQYMGFNENYEFSCAGTWDCFHTHICTLRTLL